MNARHCLAILGAVSALAIGTAPCGARAEYPDKPLKLIVGFPPGGGTDMLARYLAQQMGKSLGQSVVVENRGGANGVIGTTELARSAPDGYTLMLTISSHITNGLLYKDLPYNVLKDFAPVSVVATSPFVLLANPKLPANNVAELIALAKAKPGSINFGSPGNGSTQHLSHELMNQMADIKMTHVAYRGGAPAMNDLLAGQVSLMFLTTVQSLPFLKEKRLKALAVSSAQRAAVLPDVPTVAETIPGYDSDVWFGVIAPAGTPKPVVDKLNKDIVAIVRKPETQQWLAQQGAVPVGDTPAEFASLMQAEYTKWTDVFKKTGIKAE
ncbi:tripartite tricarboxylate transporter substrate binding protein [Bordetella sputigena]|uniref:Bug family tripartite tricarboxylate transporter substrate binding protein n=1 Tax=Bordetella sputigena TaxID=1416810 RepID=UPI0039EF3707